MAEIDFEQMKKSWKDQWAKDAQDPRTTEELIRVAIEEWDQDYDPDNRPTATGILKARGDRDTLEAVKKLCVSSNAKERAVGAYILWEFGLPDRTFPSECVHLLLEMLKMESDTEVLNSICTAFSGYDRDTKMVVAVSQFKTHPHEDVRFGVVQGLLWCPEETAISTLIELSRDADDDVRDWATFGIGQIIDNADNPEQFDTPPIRQALYDRLDDPHWETSFEALAGLALRRDTRIVNRIVKMLVDDQPMANSELCDALRDMRHLYTGNEELLERALSQCVDNTEFGILGL